VSCQVGLVGGVVITVRTLEALPSSVHSQVRRDVALFAGAVVTLSTLEPWGCFSPVCTRRCCFRLDARGSGAVITVSTLEGLLSSVHSQVSGQVALGGAVLTVTAREALLRHIQESSR
jgi:hypothetical protein